MQRNYNLRNRVLGHVLCLTLIGCTALPSKLGMDGDPSLTPQHTSTEPVVALPRNTQSQALDYIPNGIIMGNVGSGKTTLLNKLSNTTHATSGDFGDSVTRELFREPVAHGDHPFRLVDTPGINGEEEVYKHSYLLKSAYEAMPYNSIFVVVPFQNRSALVKNEWLDLTRYVKRYQPNLVLMLSCLDRVIPEERSIAKRNVANLSGKLGIRHTIMYGRDSNPTDLANAMYACMSNTPRIEISVSDEEFFSKFKIYDPGELSVAYNDFKEKSERLLKEYMNFLHKTLPDIQNQDVEEGSEVLDKANLIKAIGLSLDDELKQYITDFEEKYGHTMIELDSYTAHIDMSKKKIEIVDEFLGRTKRFMGWDIMDPNDVRNQIKQCPHCSQFLVKVGCDGITACGDMPRSYDTIDDQGSASWYKYMIKRVDGKLQIVKQTLQTFLPKKEPISKSEVYSFVKRQLKPGAQLGLAGCGGRFDWGTAPFLTGQTFQRVIKELNSTTEQAVENIAKATKKEVKPRSNVEEMGITNEAFSIRREAYERQIDTTIKSDRDRVPTLLQRGTSNLRDDINDTALDTARNHPNSNEQTVSRLSGTTNEAPADNNKAIVENILLVVNYEHREETERLYPLSPETVTDPRINREKQQEIEKRMNLMERDLEVYNHNLQILEALEVQDPTHSNRQLPTFRRGKKRLQDAIASLKSVQVQLQRKCTTAHEALFESIENEDQKAIDILFEDPRLDVNGRYGHNIPLIFGVLSLCMTKKNVEIDVMKTLLIKGADINIKTYNKMTPLHLAVRGVRLKIDHETGENIQDDIMVRLLLNHNADVQATDNNDHTVLRVARDLNSEDGVPNLNVIALLEQAGAR
ncbi:MAG: GTPase [Bacteroidota bacterium]